MTASPPIDVLVIGAGPAGSVAAALARRKGWSVRMLEKSRFPRFVIGESLLPQCMGILDEAGMLEAVEAAGFQYKNGAQIAWGERIVDFEFSQKATPGFEHTFQVTRADFDALLAREAAAQGADVQFGQDIVGIDFTADGAIVTARDPQGQDRVHEARFVLDASGFGRSLPRLLGLDLPSDFPVRASIFSHVEHRIEDAAFDPHKIRVAIHPQHREVWYWLIPLANGIASIGVVASDDFIALGDSDTDTQLWTLVNQEPGMRRMLEKARQLWPARTMRAFASKVSRTHGPGYALLGNAAEFLDPVFSSGVTIAMNSAKLAVEAMDRELRGEAVDWDVDFAKALMLGVDTFRGYVETWYEGALQDVMFSSEQPERLRRMMCGVLAGYAWDKDNPYVGKSGRRLRAIAQTVREQGLGMTQPL